MNYTESTHSTFSSLAEQLNEETLEAHIAKTQRRYNLPMAANDFLEGWNNTERALMHSSTTGQLSSAENCANWALFDLNNAHTTLGDKAQNDSTLMPIFIDTCMALANWPSVEQRLFGTVISPNKSFKLRANFIEIARYALHTCEELPESNEDRQRILHRVTVALGAAFLARQPEALGWPQLASPRECLSDFNIFTLPRNSTKKRMRFLRYWRTSASRHDESIALMPLGNILNSAGFKDNPYEDQPITDRQRMTASFWLAISALENELQEKESDTDALDRTMAIMQKAFTAQQMNRTGK